MTIKYTIKSFKCTRQGITIFSLVKFKLYNNKICGLIIRYVGTVYCRKSFGSRESGFGEKQETHVLHFFLSFPHLFILYVNVLKMSQILPDPFRFYRFSFSLQQISFEFTYSRPFDLA